MKGRPEFLDSRSAFARPGFDLTPGLALARDGDADNSPFLCIYLQKPGCGRGAAPTNCIESNYLVGIRMGKELHNCGCTRG
jgi:hypothetical protein